MGRCIVLIVFAVLVVLFVSLPVSAATVKGKVLFSGKPPAVEKVEVKSDTSICGEVQEVSKIIVGQGGGVQDVVVKIIGAKGDVEQVTGTLDQIDCQFVPHVQILPVGSTVYITSSDSVLHNAHGFFEDGSTAFNIAVPIPGMQVTAKLKKPGFIRLRCDAGHPWMSAYLVVSEEPYFALTDAEGRYSMKDVPPGDYEIEVWHEWLGKHRRPLKVTQEGTSIDITLQSPS